MDSVSYKTHPHRGKKNKKVSKIKLTYRFNTTFLCRFSVRIKKYKSKILLLQASLCSYRHTQTLIFGRQWKAMAQTENGRFALVTRIYISHLSVIFKCAHVPPARKHFQKTVLPHHFVKGWPVLEQIPTKTQFLETQMHWCYTYLFKTWLKETGRQQEGRGGQ